MAGRGRPRSMPDSDLRQRMYTAAAELLDEAGGLSLSLEHLNMETVMRRADVSRSAVYRIWPTKEDFNHDLLDVLAAPSWMGAAALDEDTPRLAQEIVLDRPELLGTAEGRRAVLLEAVRQAAWQNFEAITSRPSWRTFVVLSMTLRSMPPGERREQLAAKLRQSDDYFSGRMSKFYAEMLPVLGLRPRSPFTEANVFDMLAKIGGALVEGLALHHDIEPELASARYPGPGGEWSAPALGFLAIIDAITEPDPDYAPPGGL